MKRLGNHLGPIARAAWVVAALRLCGGTAVAVMPVNPRDRAFLGSWTITASKAAPWQTAAYPSDAAEMKRLTGSRIIFAKDRIVGPRPLACRNPHYRLRDYATDMLFQGGLSASRTQARALGFAGSTVATLETGCDGALDFHFVSSRGAMFALNNRIYTVTRDGR